MAVRVLVGGFGFVGSLVVVCEGVEVCMYNIFKCVYVRVCLYIIREAIELSYLLEG